MPDDAPASQRHENSTAPELPSAPQRASKLAWGLAGLLALSQAASTSWLAIELQHRDERIAQLDRDLSSERATSTGLRDALDTSEAAVKDLSDALQTETQLRENLESSLDRTHISLEDAMTRVRFLKDLRAEMRGLIVDLNARVDDLAGERLALSQRLDAVLGELDATQGRLRELEGTLSSLRDEQATTQETLAAARGQLDDLQARSETLREQLRRLELEYHINVRRRLGLSDPPAASGQIIKITPATPPLLIVNLGEAEGIEFDELLYIIRDGKVIGEARVNTVEKVRSTARVTRMNLGAEPLQGDLVATRPPKS